MTSPYTLYDKTQQNLWSLVKTGSSWVTVQHTNQQPVWVHCKQKLAEPTVSETVRNQTIIIIMWLLLWSESTKQTFTTWQGMRQSTHNIILWGKFKRESEFKRLKKLIFLLLTLLLFYFFFFFWLQVRHLPFFLSPPTTRETVWAYFGHNSGERHRSGAWQQRFSCQWRSADTPCWVWAPLYSLTFFCVTKLYHDDSPGRSIRAPDMRQTWNRTVWFDFGRHLVQCDMQWSCKAAVVAQFAASFKASGMLYKGLLASAWP